ncbi:hypothetical protein KRR38_14355 [Novosphingobium sp. G106]|uniref:hypothetical protein n=1 Tax=Novosphingobium sp. G106 TaxID=2849500 RepID=UPI001C2CCAB1|nr:hypothetical protein [Novosphingobium sp. G106]MBV1688821.1 hypothetical protein [Novosphingobium sp. G106]
MIGKTKLAFLAALLPIIVVVPAQAYERLPAGLAQLSPADFASKVRIVDDPLEPAIVLSTQDGYTRGRPIKGAQANDVHLRALVDRATGQVSWQVWHQLSYVGQQRNLESVQYLAGGALDQSQVMAVENWLDQCPPTDGIGSCNQFMKVGFELSDRTIREIAAAYRAGQQTPWRLRFKDRNGRDVTGGLAPAEAAGLLDALETWKRAAG